MDMIIRTIEPKDDAGIANIIRRTLEEFKANKPGTVYFDQATDRLSSVFSAPQSVYYVVEQGSELLGGAGIYPTAGLGNSTCELVKMYLKPDARGKGIAKMLLHHCFEFARNTGFENIYLETMPELATAVKLYEKKGFKRLSAPLGNSGHGGCGIWMLRKIDDTVV
jgi:putative acetyltransferase